MQSTLCKRIARSFELQRYIPEYQVYELCIHWESEIPIPPTIFYLSEIFIYPYGVHHLSLPIKKELQTTPSKLNKLILEPETMLEEHDSSTFPNCLSRSNLASFGLHETTASNIKCLDYDHLLGTKIYANEIKARNKQIVRHNEIRAASDAKKKRKF